MYANEGVVQLLFFEGDPCSVSYEDRQGKYQGQEAEVVTVEERVSATGYCSAGFHLEEWVNESNAIAGFDFARFRTIG